MSAVLKAAAGAAALAFAGGPFLFAAATPSPAVLAASVKAQPVAAGCVAKKAPAAVTVTGVEQTDYARIIATVGASMGVPRDGQIIAVATAIVESGLRNVAYGDRDSVGLFQQRASWGTVDERMDPSTSARLFYERLQGIPWQSMDPGEAAADIQRPAAQFRGRYSDHMEEAARLVGGGAQPVPVEEAVPCPQPVVAVAGGTGGFTDGTSGGVGNSPRTVAQAIAWARAQAATGPAVWYRRCLAFVAQAYGHQYSGVSYAIDHIGVVSAQDRHEGDRNPPPGALLYWSTGSRAGHVAISVGGGMIASNDIRSPGRISIVPASAPETEWHAKYIGWSTPGAFPRGG